MATKKKTEAQVISEAMGLLGRRTSEKKRAAVARNNVATRFKAKPLEELECVCGQCPDNPKTYCPRGRAIIRRAAKANAPAWTQERGNMTNAIEYSTVTQSVGSKDTRESREAKRREAVAAGFGKFAHCGETPEERRRAKDEELQREAAL